MKYSGNDTLTKIVAEAMPSLMPASEMRRWKRIDHAISDDGYINAGAVQLLDTLLVTALLDDTQYNSTSTTDYTTCCEMNPTLGNGTWTMIVQAQSRGGHSASSNIDYRLNIDGIAYNEVTRSAPTSATQLPFFTNAVIPGLDGGRTVNVRAEFKCDSAATVTITDSTLQIIAVRTA
jgi:hypothetical protein